MFANIAVTFEPEEMKEKIYGLCQEWVNIGNMNWELVPDIPNNFETMEMPERMRWGNDKCIEIENSIHSLTELDPMLITSYYDHCIVSQDMTEKEWIEFMFFSIKPEREVVI